MSINVRELALRILARRDHSERELRQKLLQRQCSQEDVDLVVEYCLCQDWLDDKRFADNFLRQAAAKGHGWRRICFDAKHKGIDTALLECAQEKQQHDWYELAKALAQRRFADIEGVFPAVDLKQRRKWIQHLERRGFSFEQIQYALENDDLE